MHAVSLTKSTVCGKTSLRSWSTLTICSPTTPLSWSTCQTSIPGRGEKYRAWATKVANSLSEGHRVSSMLTMKSLTPRLTTLLTINIYELLRLPCVGDRRCTTLCTSCSTTWSPPSFLPTWSCYWWPALWMILSQAGLRWSSSLMWYAQ